MLLYAWLPSGFFQDFLYRLKLLWASELYTSCSTHVSESLRIGYPLPLLIECEALAEEEIKKVDWEFAKYEEQ